MRPHDGPPESEVTGEAAGADGTRVLMRLAVMLTMDEVRNGRTPLISWGLDKTCWRKSASWQMSRVRQVVAWES